MSYFEFLIHYQDSLLRGILVTLKVYGLAVALGTALSVILALLRMSPFVPVRTVALLYVELFRSTPLMVQLFWMYFVLPLLGFSFSSEFTGILCLGSNMGAYGSEAVKGAIQAVPRGQYEVSVALNLSPYKRMTRIILPQALRIFFPIWGNLLVEYLKYSSLVSLIAIPDLMYQIKSINNATMASAQAFGTALLIYYALSRMVIIPVFNLAEKAWSKKMGMA